LSKKLVRFLSLKKTDPQAREAALSTSLNAILVGLHTKRSLPVSANPSPDLHFVARIVGIDPTKREVSCVDLEKRNASKNMELSIRPSFLRFKKRDEKPCKKDTGKM